MFTKDDETKNLTGGVTLSSVNNSYTVPASVQLKVSNQSADEVAFNTCSDVIIKSSAWIVEMSWEEVCRDITLTWERTSLSFWDRY